MYRKARVFPDVRGSLTVFERAQEIPFEIKRVFIVHDVYGDRGGHAHIDTDQVLFACGGSITVKTFDGTDWNDYHLNKPSDSLFVPSMIYIELTNFSQGASCVVFADTLYDRSRSIRSLDAYNEALQS